MSVNNSKGSIWHRWEPHIHIPGTILNNQYKTTPDALEKFCDAVENSIPPIKALGITDYYSLTSYEKVIELKQTGRLKDVDLIFPNVELRFMIATGSDKAINAHLLFSPEDLNHVVEIKRFLKKLTFSTGNEVYTCEESDLITLGKIHDPKIIDDRKALEAGANQFKVDFDQLIKNIKASVWAQKNLIIAVAGSSKDGTAGLQSDASFNQTRKKIERASNIIFSSNEGTQKFWLGEGAASTDEIISTYGSFKPCIHGSDAHNFEDIGKPTNDKFTWIKGDVVFESLRQICIEPKDRVFVGKAIPNNRTDAYVIDEFVATNADWMHPSNLSLNPGLVAIIGSRGSGKTALADLIATGGFAISQQMSDTSFIQRANEHLQDVNVTLKWVSGDDTSQNIRDTDYEDFFASSRVQYLSQKFVDQLCSAEGVTDRLMEEIERVIFTAHAPEERLGLSSFKELLDQKAEGSRNEREDHETMITQASQTITVERSKRNNLATLKPKAEELKKLIQTDKTARANLVSKGTDARLQQLEDATTAFDAKSLTLDSAQEKLREIESLKQTVSSARSIIFPNYLTKIKQSHTKGSLSDVDWQLFSVDFTGDVDTLLSKKTITLNQEIAKIKGTKITIGPDQDLTKSLTTAGTALSNHNYEILSQEVERLKKLIGIDNENAKQYSRLSDRILRAENELEKLNKEIDDADGAQKRIDAQLAIRKNGYLGVFEAIIEEENDLKELYQPLIDNLKTQAGSLGKLSFVVRRQVDATRWAERGEDLLDLRKQGAFRGKGSLLDAVESELTKVWETGTAEEISNALTDFRDKHENDIVEHSQADRKDRAEFSKWANKIAEWLYSTDHISTVYSVTYDGVDIEQLSPGTRGIVLLLLYLALDTSDERPLIIDQPEENLDPKSIFDELVPLFKQVKLRRQIVIVTHNANLVVNTDADQVIVAKATSHIPGHLPQISYTCGGLENGEIRRSVCEILEGGEAAFKERAKRLRVII